MAKTSDEIRNDLPGSPVASGEPWILLLSELTKLHLALQVHLGCDGGLEALIDALDHEEMLCLNAVVNHDLIEQHRKSKDLMC